MSQTRCKYVGQVAETLHDGRPIEPDENVEVDLALPHNKLLFDEGKLLSLEEPKEPTLKELKERAAGLDIEGRSSMNADQLREAIADAETKEASA